MNMNDYEIFDAHLHSFGIFLSPDEDILRYMNRFNIKKAIITTTNRAARLKKYFEKDDKKNIEKDDGRKIGKAFENFKKMMPKGQLDHLDVINIAEKAPERFYKFFWFNPKIKTEEEEHDYKILEDHLKKDFCGVKIHSGMHLIKVPRDLFKLVSFMQEYNELLPLYIHSIPKVSFFSGIASKDFAKLAKTFPKLRIIVGHAASTMEYALELGLTLQNYKNVFFETSSSIPYGIYNLVRTIGQKRVIFGSDAPITSPIQIEIDKILALPLSSEQKQDILYNNAKDLLKNF